MWQRQDTYLWVVPEPCQYFCRTVEGPNDGRQSNAIDCLFVCLFVFVFCLFLFFVLFVFCLFLFFVLFCLFGCFYSQKEQTQLFKYRRASLIQGKASVVRQTSGGAIRDLNEE